MSCSYPIGDSCVASKLIGVPGFYFSFPLEPMILDYALAAYSMVPLIIVLVSPIVWAIALFACIMGKSSAVRLIRLSKASGFAIMVILCFALTNLIKVSYSQKRPVESCINSCGFPSEGSAYATSTLAFGITHLMHNYKKQAGSPRKLRYSTVATFFYIVLLVVLFFPVLIAQLRFKDNTFLQILTGSLLGLFLGVVLAVLSVMATNKVIEKFKGHVTYFSDIPSGVTPFHSKSVRNRALHGSRLSTITEESENEHDKSIC